MAEEKKRFLFNMRGVDSKIALIWKNRRLRGTKLYKREGEWSPANKMQAPD